MVRIPLAGILGWGGRTGVWPYVCTYEINQLLAVGNHTVGFGVADDARKAGLS